MSNDLVFVLDLGSTKAVCMAARATGDDKIEVVAMAHADCRGVKRGAVADLDDSAMAVSEVIRKVSVALGEDVNRLVVAIGGSHVEGVNAQGFVPIVPQSRPINSDDVLRVVNHSRQLMMPPDREQIQAIPREFRVNGQRGIAKPIGMNGSKLEVMTYIVTGHTPNVQNLERVVQMAGARVDGMVLMPLASGLGVLSEQDRELGVVVVDIGGGTTDMAVFANGSIAFHASLPIAGQLVTSDLSKLLKTTPDEAERLKLRYGGAVASMVPEGDSLDVNQIGQDVPRPMQRRVFCEIVESRMRELAVMVRQQIERSGFTGMLPGGVVLTGGGSLLPNTEDLFETNLSHMRVRRGVPKAEGQLKHSLSRPEYATALGLARYALDTAADEYDTATGDGSWKGRVRSLFSMFGSK